MDIREVINSIVEKHADEIKNALYAALEEENAEESVAISEIKAGDHFEYKGIEWVCLDVGNDAGNKTAFAVSAKIIADMPFNNEYEDGCNNWRTSSLRKWLNSEFLDENFDKGALLTICSALIADNGDDKYGFVEDYVTLIDCDQYRKYRKFMPKYDDWVWTLTPRSCGVGVASSVRYVSPSGELGVSSASNAYGVAPACLFNLNYLSSCRQAHIITTNDVSETEEAENNE